MNKLIDSNIKLIKESHTYVHEIHKEIEFTSATSVVSQYLGDFNAAAIAHDLVTTNSKYTHRTEEDIIAGWNAAADHGTKVHEEIEDHIKKGKIPKEKKSLLGIDWLTNYKLKHPMDIMSEVIIYSAELGIAGTIDIISKNTKNDQCEIIDWKTGKIKFKSYQGKMGNHEITKDLMDSNFEKYTLQLSLYRYLLEKYYGLNIINQLVAHITDDDCIGYVAPYRMEHITKIINNYNKRD